VREIVVHTGESTQLDADMLAVVVRPDSGLTGVAAFLDEKFGGAVSRLLAQGAFRADANQTEFFPSAEAAGFHLLAIGAGERAPDDAEALRGWAGIAVREARGRRLSSVAFLVPEDGLDGNPDAIVQAAAEGLTLGDWSYDDLRGEAGREKLNAPPARGIVVLPVSSTASPGAAEAASRGHAIAEAQNYARGLVARPGNVATPSFLAGQAEKLAEQYGLRVQTWGPDRLQQLGFGALLAVARGSSQEPRFIILEHRGSEDAPYVLVGKGVTFDSGGISLKPPANMGDMKYDMAGGAAVFGALRAAAELQLPARVIGLVPATENLPSGQALKPGDVVRGLAGISIEIDNTDAEGRLILSDALAYAGRLKPKAVVDLATLTGACVIALGHHAIGMMTPDDALAEALGAAGDASGERVWRLPLWSDYRKQLDSDIADIKNTGGRPASTITAGLFLKEFVGGFPWAHLDIAGTAWTEDARPYAPKGATGVGVRLLIEWLRATQ
jgi:leucyl aminopeptidase